MNLRDLTIFKMAAQLGSVNQTAKQLNYVQSNVTSRIQKLEKDLQTVLFHRHPAGISLTEDGKTLLPYAQQIIALSEEMRLVSRLQNEPSGDLNIASVETVIKLPIILSAYIKEYKQVNVTLSTGVTTDLRNKVLDYSLDGAFVTKSNITKNSQLEQIDVFEERLVLIASSDITSLDEMMGLPLLRFSDGCGYRAKLDEWLYDKQITPTKVMELGTLETTLGSVISGLGVAYVPFSTVEKYETKGQIRCFKLPKQYSHITTVFIFRKQNYMSAALKAFIETIQETRQHAGP
jgi:DNA-binding transcriptional LysR family regulator